jgi:death-on-curing protein
VKEPIWLDRVDCLAIHEMMLTQHGGLDGVRDERLLDSAVTKPRHIFSYGAPTLARLAASYAAGVIQNHPFNDGNKRTGFMLAATFLELNGHLFTATEEDIYQQTLAFAAKEIGEDQYSEWLARNSMPPRKRKR